MSQSWFMDVRVIKQGAPHRFKVDMKVNKTTRPALPTSRNNFYYVTRTEVL